VLQKLTGQTTDQGEYNNQDSIKDVDRDSSGLRGGVLAFQLLALFSF
jgi:hypothetical protein